MSYRKLPDNILAKLKNSNALIPATLMIDSKKTFLEDWQRLQTRYWIASGADTVIPAAHSGQFSLGDLGLYDRWLKLNKEVITGFGGNNMFLMAAASGAIAKDQAETAAKNGYDLLIVAPTAFKGMDEDKAIRYMQEIAEIIPVYGFYLQSAVGGRVFSQDFWKALFEFSYGAKAAPFDRELTDSLMHAAVQSGRIDELVMVTGNDDFIVGDLLSRWIHPNKNNIDIEFSAGLLGHFCTDTNAHVKLVKFLKDYRKNKNTKNPFPVSVEELAADVTAMNFVLFDSAGLKNSPAFENAVWGTEIRQAALGLAPDNRYITWQDGRIENGRPGLEKEIQLEYNARPYLTDDQFVKENLSQWKKDIGM